MDVNTLQTEFATLLGDTTTAFKSKVLVWMNDIEQEISASHKWAFLRCKGTKTLTASTEIQSLSFATPSAPTAVLASGGSLTQTTTYYVKVSYYDSIYDVEGTASSATSGITTSSTNKTINLSAIPTSSDTQVNARRIYLSTDNSTFYLYSTISDNTTTTLSITADTTSTVVPETEKYIRELDGDPYTANANGWLRYLPGAQFNYLYSTSSSEGTPDTWSDFTQDKIRLYPMPSSAIALSFYFYKKPRGLYAAGSTTIPVLLKDVFEAGVEYKGYKYRDRDGYATKEQIYRMKLKKAIEDFGRPFRTPSRVRDVMGDSDGFTH